MQKLQFSVEHIQCASPAGSNFHAHSATRCFQPIAFKKPLPPKPRQAPLLHSSGLSSSRRWTSPNIQPWLTRLWGKLPRSEAPRWLWDLLQHCTEASGSRKGIPEPTHDPRTRLVGLTIASLCGLLLSGEEDGVTQGQGPTGWRGSRKRPRAVRSAPLRGDTWAGALLPSLPSSVALDVSGKLSVHILILDVI